MFEANVSGECFELMAVKRRTVVSFQHTYNAHHREQWYDGIGASRVYYFDYWISRVSVDHYQKVYS